MEKIPSLLTIYLTIAEMTIREALRKRLLIIILLITSFFLLMNITCNSMSCSQNGEDKSPSEMGEFFFFFLATFWNFGIAEQITSSLVTEELENKNYLIFFSKPIAKINYYLGKTFGIISIILVNTIIIFGVYSISTLIRYGTINPNLWKAIAPMFLGFMLLVSIVVFLSLSLNKTGAVMLSSAMVLFVMILNGIYYEPQFEKGLADQGTWFKAGQVLYWIFPQIGSLYYYSSSLFDKKLSQVHYLGEYSMIQVSVWIALIWGFLYQYLNQKEFEG